ncbi:P-loop NTPase fold protein [Prevotella sp.]|uniref:P-loop NTPase fold protein n=1 Tax=Prevotella sp. TaxID=59823 RepID=UPI0025F0A662|nr:P-loop NTPase fold protein [Prevotella sp.]
MSQHLYFNIGQESRPVIEKLTEQNVKKSLFFEQYKNAFDSLSSYLKVLKTKDEEENEPLNNIFAFIGERGAGKTSCMLSVANELTNKSENSILDNYQEVKKLTFHKLSMIDPSFFDEKHGIIAEILASLYNEYRITEKSNNSFEKTEILGKFADLQKDFNCLLASDAEKPYDDLEQLVSLSAAVNLRANFGELVTMFMKYIGKPDGKLIIMIDDIDLHTNQATIMVEQIRKYLVQPNVVILLAIKLDQLAMLKRQQYTIEYKVLLEKGKVSEEVIDEMVERYLTKLIPFDQRIFMPKAQEFLGWELTIKSIQGETEDFSSVRMAIPELIFRKTRYLFYNTALKTSYIVPRNLRELRSLLKLLVGMPKSNTANNKEQFKKYFFENWVLNNLNTEQTNCIYDLLKVTDAFLFNAAALRIIKKQFFLERDMVLDNSEISNILNENNVVYNISLGDVMAIISYLEKQDQPVEKLHFLFMIRSIYSMRLYEFYDERTEDSTNVSKKQERVIGLSPFENLELSNYEKLVGGSFVNSIITDILPKAASSADTRSRSVRMISLTQLNLLLSECIEHFDEIPENVIMLSEFFMLCISRYIDTKDRKNQDSNFLELGYRKTASVRYAEDLKSRKYALFDLNSFMCNIVDIERCYNRFLNGDAFLEKVKNDDAKKSFYAKVKDLTDKRTRERDGEVYKAKDINHKWLSWASIRNAEILEDLIEYQKEISYSKASEFDIFSHYFMELSAYKRMTYDRTDNGKEDYYELGFSFVKVLSGIFNAKDYNIARWFKAIYDVGYQGSTAIDVKALIKGRQVDGNRADTVRKYIEEHYPVFVKQENVSILDDVFSQFSDKLSKAEIEKIAKRINEIAKSKIDGSSSTDA